MGSDLNGDDEDAEEAINEDVPEDVRANLDADGVYSTPTDRLWTTNDTSNTAAKKARKNLNNSSNKKGRKTSTSSSAANASFNATATQFMS